MSATVDSIPGIAGKAAASVDEKARRAARRIGELHRSVRSYTAPLLFGATVLTALLIGKLSHLERFITPEYGTGYVLGIVGGTMMLCLLLYPLRKRFRSLQWMGPIKSWFRLHMIFGIVGPSLILFHCNFSLGATNSNVALFSMLVVSTSGIIGRYFYARIHHGLYGARVRLDQIKQDAEMARYGINKVFSAAPGLAAMLDEFEREAVRPARGFAATAMNLMIMPIRVHFVRRAALRRIEEFLATQKLDRRARQDMLTGADRFLRVHLDAVRRVADTGFYERMFAMWHVLHLPLFVMLIVTAVFHVIAVHVY